MAAQLTDEMTMHLAAQADDAPGLKALLEKGVFVDARNASGSTPLHTAALHGSLKAAAVLLLKFANVKATDNLGTTPIHVAARGWSSAMVELLLGAGADPSAKDRDGDTPLRWANRYYTRREEFPHLTEREFAEQTIRRSRVISALLKALEEL